MGMSTTQLQSKQILKIQINMTYRIRTRTFRKKENKKMENTTSRLTPDGEPEYAEEEYGENNDSNDAMLQFERAAW